MKIQSSIALFIPVLTAAIIVVGCSTANYAKQGSTSATMEKTGESVEAMVKQTDQTLTTLSNLVYEPAADLVPQYKAFADATENLASLSKTTDQLAMRMRQSANAYFAAWDTGTTNIANPEFRQISEQRKAEVNKAFDKAADSLRRTKAAFDPFLSDVQDMRQMLSLDLTLGGVEAVKPVARKAVAHGRDLKEALTEAADDIHNLAVRLSPKTEPPAQ